MLTTLIAIFGLSVTALVSVITIHLLWPEEQPEPEPEVLSLPEDLRWSVRPDAMGKTLQRREIERLRGHLRFHGTGRGERLGALEELARSLELPEARALIEELARHPQSEVREQVIAALSAYRTQTSFEIIAREAERARLERRYRVLARAIDALMEWQLPETERFLCDLLTTQDPHVLALALDALSRLGSASSVEALQRFSDDAARDPADRAQAERIIATIYERIDPTALARRGALSLAELDAHDGALSITEAQPTTGALTLDLPPGAHGLGDEPTEPPDLNEPTEPPSPSEHDEPA